MHAADWLAAQATSAAQLAQTQPEETPCAAGGDGALCRAIFRATDNELLARSSELLLIRPAKILLIALVAFVANRLLRRAIRRFVSGLKGERVRKGMNVIHQRTPMLVEGTQPLSIRSIQRAETVGVVLRSMASAVIWVMAGIMILGQLGLADSLGPLVAGAGIVGIALGFGAQNLVRDFLSGIFMLIEDQYGVGDVIDVGPASGTVEAVTLRTTRIRDVEGNLWHVPNGTIQWVANKSQQWSRAVLDISVAYDTDVRHAIDILTRTATDLWQEPAWDGKILEQPEVWGVEQLGADGMAIRLVVKTRPLAQWEVARELRARIKAAFDAEGIEIPFPQRVVWHRSAAADGDGDAPGDGADRRA